jgi:hypothetical protein
MRRDRPCNPHVNTARDAFSPLASDGTPKLLGAWRYLLGAAEEEDDRDEDGHDD